MPDEAGNKGADDVPDTPLHAYKDGREEDVKPGSRGVTGDQGKGDDPSYQDGGHDDDPEPAAAPAADRE